MTTAKRPAISNIQSGEELKKWYWLKEELVAYARHAGISYVGSKLEIIERLASLLDGIQKKQAKKKNPDSAFNWPKEHLFPKTIITDSYTNGPNTRTFFKKYCGDKFRFTIPFMNWMKTNTGKRLKDAIAEWKRLDKLSKDKNFISVIPEGNQYNKYIRDFFADNPGKTMKDARQYWKLKRSLPSGRHIYERSDLQLKGE